jgi:hypothetical protein
MAPACPQTPQPAAHRPQLPSRSATRARSRTPIHAPAARRDGAAAPAEAFTPVAKKPLPAGLPRGWYEAHNRQLKAMRLAIALLDAGVLTPAQARNRRIRSMAARIGVRPPSPATCALVRALLPDPR